MSLIFAIVLVAGLALVGVALLVLLVLLLVRTTAARTGA